MIKFPLQSNARVELIDNSHALLSSITIDQTTQAVKHLVVADARQGLWMVPLEAVISASHDVVRLRVTQDIFSSYKPFDANQYLAAPDDEGDFISAGEGRAATIYYLPAPEGAELPDPTKDLTLIRGAYVEARDGVIGEVTQIVIDAESGKISHLVIHTHGEEEVTLPVAVIDSVQADTIRLKIAKADVESLPSVEVEHGKRGYELVARIFDDEVTAEMSLNELQGTTMKMSRHWIYASAVLVRDKEGKVSIKESGDMDTKKGSLYGAVTGGLVGLIGGPVGVIVGALAGAGAGGLAADKIDRGISNEFLERFSNEMKPGSSAMVLLIDREGLPGFSNAMSNLSGVMVKEELTELMLERLMQSGSQQEG